MIENCEFSLPPSVFGKAKSYLTLSIDRIYWRTSKVFNDVKIVVRWWGDKNGHTIDGIRILENKKSSTNESSLKKVQYQVKTNHKLFQSYLANCEPIVFDIYSLKTQDFIGSAKVEIPVKFLTLLDGEEKSFKKSSKILSSRQFNLGDLDISVKYSPLEMTQKTSSSSSSSRVKKIRSKSQDRINAKSSNKENIEIIGLKKKMSTREPIPVKSTTLIKKIPSKPPSVQSNKKTPLMDYLSGAQMSKIEQKNALNDLVTESPAKDLIKSLSPVKLDILCSTITKIEFNALGQMQIQSFISQNQHGKFVVKCVAKSKIFVSEDFNVLSPIFETTPSSKWKISL